MCMHLVKRQCMLHSTSCSAAEMAGRFYTPVERFLERLLTAIQASNASSSTKAHNERPSPFKALLVFLEEPESSRDSCPQVKSLLMYHQHSDDIGFRSY